MFCCYCGRKIKDGDKYCAECGTKIEYFVETEMKTDVYENAVSDEKVSSDNAFSQPSDSAIIDATFDETQMTAENETVEYSEIYAETENVFAQEDTEEALADDLDEEKSIPAGTFDQQHFKGVDEETIPENVQKNEQMKDEIKHQKIKKTTSKSIKKIGIGYRILSFFLCVILLAVVLSTALLGVVRTTFTSENVAACIEKIGVSGITFDGESLGDIVYDNSSKELLDKLGLDRAAVAEIVSVISFDEVSEDILMPYVNYVLGFTNESPEVDPQAVTRILENNKSIVIDIIEKYAPASVDADILFSQPVIKSMQEQTERFFANVSVDFVNEELSVFRTCVRMVSEKLFYVCMTAVCVLLGILVLFANKFSFFRTVGNIGVVSIVVCVILGFAYLLCLAMPMLINIPAYILILIEKVELSLLTRVGVYALAGLLFIAVYKVAAAIRSKKARG